MTVGFDLAPKHLGYKKVGPPLYARANLHWGIIKEGPPHMLGRTLGFSVLDAAAQGPKPESESEFLLGLFRVTVVFDFAPKHLGY